MDPRARGKRVGGNPSRGQQQEVSDRFGRSGVPPAEPPLPRSSSNFGAASQRSATATLTTTKTSSSAANSSFTASSTSELPHSTSSDGGRPSSSSRSRSEAWDYRLSLANADYDADDRSSTASDTPHVWPRTESDSSEEDQGVPGTPAPKRGDAKSGGAGSRFFRSLMKKFGISYKRYGFLPNNKAEQDRNVLQHQIIQELFDGRSHLAPVNRPKRVLDIGTGPGLWALEYAQKNPATAVLGIDIEPVRPPYRAPNCRFLVMDATEPWTLDTKFDLIHVRMLGDIPGKAQLLQSIYDNLNPGGWVEFTEWIVHLRSPNHSFQGSAFHRWNRLLHQGLHALGSSVHYVTQYKSLLRKAGFEKIVETKNAAPTNPCYPGKSLQKVGTMMTSNWMAVIEPLTIPVFTSALGWTPDQTHALLAEVKSEIGDTRYHSFMTLMTLYARKPKDGSSATSVSDSASSSSIHVTAHGIGIASSGLL